MKSKPSLTAELLTSVSEAMAHAAAAAAAAARAVSAVQGSHPGGTGMLDRPPFAEPREAASPPACVQNPPRQPAVIRLRRLYFGCPACHRPTVLPASWRGCLVSCPRCYTGIRVPDPHRRIPAQNLGRTMHPMLHPGDFSRVMDSRRLLPWMLGRLPTLPQAMAAAGLLLLLGSLTSLLPTAYSWASHDRRHAGPAHTMALRGPRELTAEAEAALRAFLSAPDVESKADWVADPERVIPLMKDWYARKTGGSFLSKAVLGGVTQGFYDKPGDQLPVSQVEVTLPGLPPTTYFVEHRPDGARIAWPESVGYSPVDWTDLVRQPLPAHPVKLRVLACRDDYFNNSFTREDSYFCLRLHDPQTRELLGYGYAPRTEMMEYALQRSLPPPGSDELAPILISARAMKTSAATRQVELVGLIQPGWQETEAPAADASGGTSEIAHHRVQP